MNLHTMEPVAVRLYDGVHPRARRARMRVASDHVEVMFRRKTQSFEFTKLSVSPRVARAPRFVSLPDGTQLECADGAWLDGLPQAEGSEVIVSGLERRWAVVLLGTIGTLLGLTAFLLFGLNSFTNYAVGRFDPAAERRWGQKMLPVLDREYLQPSNLNVAKVRDLQARFDELTRVSGVAGPCDLHHRASQLMKANAFTLPGCSIVVTDDLVAALDVESVMAVLAHELGHVHHRHALQTILRDSILTALVGVVSSDVAAIGMSSGAALLLLERGYSRQQEREADAFALSLLDKLQISRERFVQVFEKLDQSNGSLLSTHPGYRERVEAARGAAP
jgi:Zn-dependent protease with chaperone function